MAPKDIPKSIGRYEVVDRLGHGGMGIVYLGRDPRIGRRVAIKLLRVPEDDVRDRFLQEAQAAGNLTHRNIITIYDYGEHEGQPYIVMEFIEGTSLAVHIRDRSPFTFARKLEIAEELSTALDYAHNEGLVHRDVKPANIMIARDGTLKVVDFGIARVQNSSLTQSGIVMGTPHYMSPEQISGRAVDRRSDIFAVGLVFYELLSYCRAFSGATPLIVMDAIVQEPPLPLAQACPGIDPAVERITDRALQKDPSKRYQTLAAMSADIGRVRARLASSARAIDSTIETEALAGPDTSDRKTPASGAGREALAKRRLERVESFRNTAQLAYDAGDYAAALEACVQAALLDPDEPRVIALMDRSRTALDAQRVDGLCAGARACLDHDDLEGAAQLLDQARQIDPRSEAVTRVAAALAEREEHRRKQAELRRTIDASLARARTAMSNGNPESAIRSAGEVLMHDPANAEAHELTRTALAVLDEKRLREQHDRAARAAIEDEGRAFAAGHRREAIQALEAFTPPHDEVTAALAEMRVELAAIEQREREEAERRRIEAKEAESRRLEHERWIAQQFELAQDAIGARQFADALDVLQRIRRREPDAAGLTALFERARAGQTALDAEVSLRRAVAAHVDHAADERERGRFPEALLHIDAALEIAPDQPELIAERREIEAAIEADRRQQALEAAADTVVVDATPRFDAGARHVDAAEARLGKTLAIDPNHEGAREARAALDRRRDDDRRELDGRARLEAEAPRAGPKHGISRRRATIGVAATVLLLGAGSLVVMWNRNGAPSGTPADGTVAATRPPANSVPPAATTTSPPPLAVGAPAGSATPVPARAEDTGGAARSNANLPELTRPVNDFAHVIDAASASEIDRISRTLLAATSDVVVVATVETIEPYTDVREYALKLFENHGRGIGERGKDNGALILLALKERKVRIEVGRGLAQWITNEFAAATIGVATVEFQAGRYGPGLRVATERIVGRIAQGRNVTLRDPAAIHSRVRDLLAQGDEGRALSVMDDGLGVNANDPELLDRVDQMLGRAAATATRARNDAVSSGAPTFAREDFSRGVRRLREGERLKDTRKRNAIRAFWAAGELFKTARDHAVAARGDRASQTTPATSTATPAESPRAPAQPPPVGPPVPDPDRRSAAPPPPVGRPDSPQDRRIAPPAIDTEADKRAIEQVLARLETAFNAFDVPTVTQLAPSLGNAVARASSQYRSYTMTLAGKQILVEGDIATVTCVRQIQMVTRASNVSQRGTVPTTFRLRRLGNSWRIEAAFANDFR